jgi:hypothetical protein
VLLNLAQTSYLDPQQSFTNGSKPTDVEAILAGLVTNGRMTDSTYPASVLP